MCNAVTSGLKKAGFRGPGWDPLNISDPLNITPTSWVMGNKPFTYDREYGGALAKWYRNSTRPPQTTSSSYKYTPPSQYSTSPSAYGYGGQATSVSYVPAQTKEYNSFYTTKTEDEQKKTILPSSTNTTVSNIS